MRIFMTLANTQPNLPKTQRWLELANNWFSLEQKIQQQCLVFFNVGISWLFDYIGYYCNNCLLLHR